MKSKLSVNENNVSSALTRENKILEAHESSDSSTVMNSSKEIIRYAPKVNLSRTNPLSESKAG